jgi:hypothetical protein
VSAQKVDSTPKDSAEKKSQEVVFVYMNHLRQKFVTKIPMKNTCAETMPYLVMDTGDEDNQSRKLFKPIVPNLIGNTVQQTSSMMQMSNEPFNGNNTKTALTNRSNVMHVRASTVDLPTPESQISYKPITPNATPLPPSLKTLDRSKPM